MGVGRVAIQDACSLCAETSHRGGMCPQGSSRRVPRQKAAPPSHTSGRLRGKVDGRVGDSSGRFSFSFLLFLLNLYCIFPH